MQKKSQIKNKSLKTIQAVQRDDLLVYLSDLLQVPKIKDYCPNGLQVQGSAQIKKIVSGVTASKALIEAAINEKADAILVHHGWFWKNDDPVIVGQLHSRLKLLMEHNINLMAYHLPLDMHPKLGNNAQLGKLMGWAGKPDPINGLIWQGRAAKTQNTVAQLARSVASRLGRDPLVLGDRDKPIRRIAWCTGAAQSYIKEAVSMKVDAYISGEVSEPTYHIAQELGIVYVAAGHHATERYGVSALGEHLSTKFGILHTFIDIPNPV